jgi:hypothetical protein
MTAAGPDRWQTDRADGLLSLLNHMLTTRDGLLTTSRDRIRTLLADVSPDLPQFKDRPDACSNPSSYLRHLSDDRLRALRLKVASVACPCGLASVDEETRIMPAVSTRRDANSVRELLDRLSLPLPWDCPECLSSWQRRVNIDYLPPLLIVEGEGIIHGGFSFDDSIDFQTGERYQLVGRTEYHPSDATAHWRARLRVDGEDRLYDDLVQAGRPRALRGETFQNDLDPGWTLWESHIFYVKK